MSSSPSDCLEKFNLTGVENELLSSSITFDPASRPPNITFVNFTCKIEGTKLDKRIHQADLVFNFSLRLPQTEMLVNKADGFGVDEVGQSSDEDDDGTLLTTLLAKAKKQNATISSELLNEACMQFLSQVSPTKQDQKKTDENSSFSTPVRLDFSKQSEGKDDIEIETLLSPKMKKLIQRDQSVSGTNSLQYSYYGSLGFVDNQNTFNNIFGIQPTMLQITRLSQLNSNLGADSISCTSPAIKKIHEYIDKCHFDIFVSVCRDDYVGLSDPASAQRATQEICKKISILKQVSQQRGRRIVLHPAQLFDEFLVLVPSLPDNAAAWSITLCRCFYDGLTQDLQDKMEDDGFILPDLTALISKQAQLQALRVIKEASLSSYLKLEAEKKRFTQMMGNTNPSRQSISQHFTSGQDGMSLGTTVGAVHNINHRESNHDSSEMYNINHRSGNHSIAENTIQQYSSQNGVNQDAMNPYNLPFKVMADGLRYPYRADEPSVISEFALGFKGCYGCRATTHWKFREECPMSKDAASKNRFWKNLWIHRPHTKKAVYVKKEGGSKNDDMSKYQRNEQTRGPTFNTSSSLPPPPSDRPPLTPSLRGGLGRGLSANVPAWMDKKDRTHSRINDDDNTDNQRIKREDPAAPQGRLWTTSAALLQHDSSNTSRPMPLDLDNGLPGIVIRFDSNPKHTLSEEPPTWLCHLDSCAGMNTGNLAIHQYIITQHPSIVAEYIQFDDANPFDPIRLECAIPQLALEDKKQGCLTAIVRYYTKYSNADGSPVIISFGLGKDVTVNAIIGLPTLRQWGGDIILSKNIFIAQSLNREFPLDFKSATSFSCPAEFVPERDFIRPQPKKVVRIQCDNIPHTNLSTNIQPSTAVTDSVIGGVLQRRVTCPQFTDK